MNPPIPHYINKTQFWLTTERVVYWEEKEALIVSDLHFGKTGHFRKSGIAVPGSIYKEDLQRLVDQIQYFHPREIIVVGDMFHSRENKELELFLKWRSDLSDIRFRLIKGNHDILKADWYAHAGIELSHQSLSLGDFHFVHDISDYHNKKDGFDQTSVSGNNYFFSGHMHPGIRIYGSGRQSLCFPCFYFGKEHAVLPAFSRFTGVAMISPESNEQVYAIVNREIIRIQ